MCWSIDFMSDALTNGLRFRTFNVMDDFNRECLKIKVGMSLTSRVVTNCLDRIGEARGYPESIRTDNGPEFISKHFEQWAKQHGIRLIHIEPGKPAQNGYIERFNRSYREDVLDMYLFDSIREVQLKTEEWRRYYNQAWSHESLGWKTPLEFGYGPQAGELLFGNNTGRYL